MIRKKYLLDDVEGYWFPRHLRPPGTSLYPWQAVLRVGEVQALAQQDPTRHFKLRLAREFLLVEYREPYNLARQDELYQLLRQFSVRSYRERLGRLGGRAL